MSELNPALAALNAGRLDEARQLLTRLLEKSAGNVDALYFLGVTEQSARNDAAAMDLYDRLLAKVPNHGGAHYNKALLLSGMKRHQEALVHHDRAVELAPANFWAYVNRGNAKAALHHFAEAVADYDQALKLKPGLPDALANKANALLEQGLPQEALACLDEVVKEHAQHAQGWIGRCQALTELERYEEAIASAARALHLQPRHPEAWIHKGLALLKLGDQEGGLADIENAIALNPTYAKAWCAQGDAFMKMERLEDALVSYEKSLALDPTFGTWHAQGDALMKMDRLEDALASYEKSLALNPGFVNGLVNKAIVSKLMGKDEQATSSYERALRLEPNHADANMQFACLLLSQHDYAQGWEKYEHRLRSTYEQRPRSLTTSRPLWTGSETTASLLVWGEQGIGDQILYGSILPELSRFPQRKLLALDKRLHPLFERSLPEFSYVDVEKLSDALEFSEQIPLGSLPKLFRPSAESFSAAPSPYLMADPTRVNELRQRLARDKQLVCGVSWSSKRKDIGSKKSVGLAEMLLPLASDSLHFVNLQYGDTTEERESIRRNHGIDVQNLPEIDNFNDIDGLAALIQACDLVITTSNSTAHLAGALGKETLLLLPLGKGEIWYWSQYKGRNLWYPSVRMFVQDQPGDWQQPLQRLKAYLDSK